MRTTTTLAINLKSKVSFDPQENSTSIKRPLNPSKNHWRHAKNAIQAHIRKHKHNQGRFAGQPAHIEHAPLQTATAQIGYFWREKKVARCNGNSNWNAHSVYDNMRSLFHSVGTGIAHFYEGNSVLLQS